MRRSTHTDFVTKANHIHGNRYDYSSVSYKSSTIPVTVICREHGYFDVMPKTHIRITSPTGCPLCGKQVRIESRRDTTSSFIEKAISVHGDRYDYSLVNYTKSNVAVSIICKLHGVYTKKPGLHLNNKQGCPVCGRAAAGDSFRLTNEEFRRRCEDVHGIRYDLSAINYTGIEQRISVRCTLHNITVTPVANTFVSGKDPCPVCAREKHKRKIAFKKLDWDTWVLDSHRIHNNRYTYDKIDNFSLQDSVAIIHCPIHGQFEQRPMDHRAGKGCARCGVSRAANSKRLSPDIWLDRFLQVHGPRYTYEFPDDYQNNTQKIAVMCNDHGVFHIRPDHHVMGYGCTVCSGSGSSLAERDISDWLSSMEINHITHDRTLIWPKELDLVIPQHKIAIEYCGNYWHGELQGRDKTYHLNKLNAATDIGYRLITIFEDEWVKQTELVKMRLTNFIGLSKTGVAARNVSIGTPTFQEARDFLNRYHIQGSVQHMPIRIGAYHNGALVAMMGFSHGRAALNSSNVPHWELVRFATDGLNHPGMASKLMKGFRTNYPGPIVSYADRRWSIGGLYETIGFTRDSISAPSYWYMATNDYLTRKHRFGFRKSEAVRRFNADPNLTEWEIMQQNGYDRIWDCGSIKYVLE